jgi:hypothetical protein
MKALNQFNLALTLIIASLATGFAADCETLAASVTNKVEADPEKVLMIVEDAMSRHDKCACEVVKSAIVASRASGRLVGEIVFTAVISSERMAPTVAECVISVAPDSASQIRSALKRALSDTGKNTAYGKNPYKGKEPIPPADPVDDGGLDFGRAPLDVRGIYLLAPSPGGSSVEREKVFEFLPKGLDAEEIAKLLKRRERV